MPEAFRLVCTGAPSDQQKSFEGFCERIGIQSHFVFPGFLSESDFADLLVNSAGLIFPSLYEGFGIPVVEAMAAGVPVACSDVTALPEVGGCAALYFDPRNPESVADAMIRLAREPHYFKSLVQVGKQQATLFSDPMAMAEQYWQLFERVACRT
jgi:glycosyltransferase involved in cell wall biosynthesis